MVAIYCRVSTDKQEREGYSLAEQEEKGISFATSIHEQHEVYSESVSGTKRFSQRGEGKRLQNDIAGKVVDKVWVINVDRLARKTTVGLEILEFFEDHKIEFYEDGDLVDFEDAEKMLFGEIRQSIAAYERKRILKRMRSGRDRSRDEGNHAYTRMFGYRTVHDASKRRKVRWVIDEKQAEVIRFIFDCFVNKGMSLNLICKTLNDEGRRTWNGDGGTRFWNSHMRRIIERIEYSGRTRDSNGKIIDSNIYQRIIDDDTWNKAQKLLSRAIDRSFQKHVSHCCSGLIKCSSCGEYYYFHKIRSGNGDMLDYYAHHNSGLSKETCKQRPKCVDYNTLNGIFKYLYLKSMFDRKTVVALYEEERRQYQNEQSRANRNIERLQHNIIEEEEKKNRLLDLVEQDTISKDIVRERLERINNNVKRFAVSIEKYQKGVVDSKKKYETILAEFTLDNAFAFLTYEKEDRAHNQRQMIKRILKSATIEGSNINVQLITGEKYQFDYTKRQASIRIVKNIKEISDNYVEELRDMEKLTDLVLQNDLEAVEGLMKKIPTKK